MNIKNLSFFICSLLIPAFSVQAEDVPNCFIINSLGKVINLNRLCNPPQAKPSEQELRRLATEVDLLAKKKMNREVLKVINNFIVKYPAYPIAYIGRANTRFALNDLKGAIEDAQIAKFLFIRRGESEYVGGVDSLIRSFKEELKLREEFDKL